MQNVTLNVQGMSCGHCVSAVEKGVGALTGVEQVTVNLAEGLVDVAFNDAQVSVEQIKEAIDDQGYDVK
ncbi:copper chaperone CopZ [Lysinibacillus piscis]|uniref:Copper chaperone CopZ n=1 Tax=Lysinibacillus piscis TaxID=2518931 RepID=A0ABQ5NQH6_9BACI|nr:copper chaperone CopZ [Lysinibacillus sp. KH24]GLC90572.1 copper chaperone CopZ [Lysinibacillus sp. KH24]